MHLRLGNLLILAVVAALPCAALADTVNYNYNYNYNYVISLPNGASFTLTQSGPLGDDTTHSVGWSYGGAPTAGYVPPSDQVFLTTGDNGTWTELQIEWLLPDAPGSNTASSIESFTFAEPDTFWAQLGTNGFTSDSVTTYNGFLYSDENVDGSTAGPDVPGTVNQGAYYAFYTPDATDPQCTSCTITTTFVPAVTVTPEPSTMTLLGTGAVALLGAYRRRRVS